MPLPDIIEILPLDKQIEAEITVPGSKSITNRALILAALAKGTVTLRGALWSEDTQVMVDCLLKLGFEVSVAADPDESCNRTITVAGLGGKIPNAGTAAAPLDLFVGNAGTAARFLAAFVCLGNGVYRLYGIPRMHERPQAALLKALRELDYRVVSANDRLPALIEGTGPRPGKCTVSVEESSQFASALMLCAGIGGWKVKVTGENSEESPYVAMTTRLIDAFPRGSGEFLIEPDASSGSYFLAANQFIEAPGYLEYSERFGTEVQTWRIYPISVAHWPASGWQVDEQFPKVWLPLTRLFKPAARQALEVDPSDLRNDLVKTILQGAISRQADLGDSIMTAIVSAPFAPGPIKFTDLGRLRIQESERVRGLRTELTKCGAKVIETGDTLEVFPSELHGVEIETYDDHRMAMCFAILGLKVPGIKIKNPACVKKTFPNFFQKLATPPPAGLGAIVRDAHTGRRLEITELFAD